MNDKQLSRLKIHGYKSIYDCDINLTNLNVLIGTNGAGKSNFIEFFTFIYQLLEGKLQNYTNKSGGADSILHFGRKKTEYLATEIYFGDYGYQFTLEPTLDSRLMFTDERFSFSNDSYSGHFETQMQDSKQDNNIYAQTIAMIKKSRVYHFHDTSDTAVVKQLGAINDNQFLRSDARNLPAFLYFLQEKKPNSLAQIEKTIRLVAPFFDKFLLRPNPFNHNQIELEWLELDQDIPFKAHQLSDGTLRFICLATVLLQPKDYQPETIIIDEPELGLHPFAITVLASLLKSVSHYKQIIISTQSVDLLSEFALENIIVVDRENHQSKIRRVTVNEDLEKWLQDYTLGEMWEKNLLGGRPAR